MKLKDNIFLYYTNKFIEGKIIVDLIINSDSDVPLNPEGKSSNYYSFPFYEEIDNDLNKKYLYSIYYLGINSKSISFNNKIKKFEHNLKVYKSIFISKIIFLSLEFFVFFLFIITLIFIDFCKLYK